MILSLSLLPIASLLLLTLLGVSIIWISKIRSPHRAISVMVTSPHSGHYHGRYQQQR